jgi:hypothetical protein
MVVGVKRVDLIEVINDCYYFRSPNGSNIRVFADRAKAGEPFVVHLWTSHGWQLVLVTPRDEAADPNEAALVAAVILGV